jgi:hypothetical protein
MDIQGALLGRTRLLFKAASSNTALGLALGGLDGR